MRKELWKLAAQAVENRCPAALLRRLDPPATLLLLDGAPAPGQAAEGWPSAAELPGRGERGRFLSGQGEYFYQPLCPKPPLVICGAGHIGAHVAALGRMLEFDVTVIDDRADWLTPERFPGVSRSVGAYGAMLDRLPQREDTCFVIATHGHQQDLQCLERIARMPAAYVGLLGSRKKTALVHRRLEELGVPQERIDQLHMPIGLPIGGDTPAEIAVSIAAELVQCRGRNSASGFLGEPVLAQWKTENARVVVTVVGKEGSGPQIPGAVMTCNRDGTISGTIGGGSLELAACRAAEGLTSGAMLLDYDMRNDKLRSSGMVCGGETQLFLEAVEN